MSRPASCRCLRHRLDRRVSRPLSPGQRRDIRGPLARSTSCRCGRGMESGGLRHHRIPEERRDSSGVRPHHRSRSSPTADALVDQDRRTHCGSPHELGRLALRRCAEAGPGEARPRGSRGLQRGLGPIDLAPRRRLPGAPRGLATPTQSATDQPHVGDQPSGACHYPRGSRLRCGFRRLRSLARRLAGARSPSGATAAVHRPASFPSSGAGLDPSA